MFLAENLKKLKKQENLQLKETKIFKKQMTQIMVKMKRKSKTTTDLNVIRKQIYNREM